MKAKGSAAAEDMMNIGYGVILNILTPGVNRIPVKYGIVITG